MTLRVTVIMEQLHGIKGIDHSAKVSWIPCSTLMEIYIARYSSRKIKCHEERFIHVGFNNPYSDRAYWFTVDGKRLEEAGYDHWAPNEPNNVAGLENCGSLARNGDGLNDWPCNDGLPVSGFTIHGQLLSKFFMINAGAVLASPINKQVLAAMQDILKDQNHMAFTGIQSLTSTGDYFSIEGMFYFLL
ncbi:unnamed protein product [Diatraea saccharalis]|uniref:C-type lectin domain-containing protein n=1 Tax=Diatraea saccharalis TaxID=40085 RepID=A0A9N9R6A0_9NEOP|nr:unnamed protein product [Diatraea saccharalis]